jgi:hypothetical protein
MSTGAYNDDRHHVLVCINQGDIDEKSQQVALMGDIYRQCSQVRIWLGCVQRECGLEQGLRQFDSMSENSSAPMNPFELIRRLAEDQHIRNWSCFEKDANGKITFIETAAFKDLWSGFLRIAESVWWTRMWTVQEVILPKAGILTYDTWSISLDALTKCGAIYSDHVRDCCAVAYLLLPQDIESALDRFCSIFQTIDRDRNALEDDEYFDIPEQHLSYGERACQDPRDKVYGLLALIGNISDVDYWLTPDYSKSENKVFYDATVAMLNRDWRSLKCLIGAQYGMKANKWASWVRDFGMPMTHLDTGTGSQRLITYDLFDASRGGKARVEFYHTWRYYADGMSYQKGLRVSGRCVGNVGKVHAVAQGGTTSEQRNQFKETLKFWIKASQVDFGIAHNGQQHSDATRRLWRTLLGGVSSTGKDNKDFADPRIFDDSAMSWIEPFLSSLQTRAPDEMPALYRALTIALHGRCYFQTEEGAQGLGYPTTKEGDEIWVVNGSRVPFTIRREQLSVEEVHELRPWDAYGMNEKGAFGIKADFMPEQSLHGYYSLVGDCYLDGYMHGEGAEDTTHPIILV